MVWRGCGREHPALQLSHCILTVIPQQIKRHFATDKREVQPVIRHVITGSYSGSTVDLCKKALEQQTVLRRQVRRSSVSRG